jgi:hypothetical protein
MRRTTPTTVRPRPDLKVTLHEVNESGRDRTIADCLAVALDRHDEQHAEHQRQQQAPGSHSGEPQRAPGGLVQADGNPRDREQQWHSPAVDDDPDPLDPVVLIGADDVEVGMSLVDATGVVKDQQGKREDAQGVDVVAAGHWGKPCVELA